MKLGSSRPTLPETPGTDVSYELQTVDSNIPAPASAVREVRPRAPGAARAPGVPSEQADLVRLARHSDEYCPERSIVLAVDQRLGEGGSLLGAPELAVSVGAFEVGATGQEFIYWKAAQTCAQGTTTNSS